MERDINHERTLDDTMRELRVAVIQPNLLFNSKKTARDNDLSNVTHAVELLSRLKSGEHDLIVLPELYPCVAEVAIEECESLLNAAKELNSYILAGETYDGKNTSTLIDPSGKIAGRAYKVNLSVEEIGHVAPGKQPGLFDVNGIKIGVLTCWDFAFPNQVENLLKRSADVIINPSMNVKSLVGERRSDARLYVSYYRKPVVSANLAGTFRAPWNFVYGGGNSEVLESVRADIFALDRKARASDFVGKALGQKEDILKYTLKL